MLLSIRVSAWVDFPYIILTFPGCGRGRRSRVSKTRVRAVAPSPVNASHLYRVLGVSNTPARRCSSTIAYSHSKVLSVLKVEALSCRLHHSSNVRRICRVVFKIGTGARLPQINSTVTHSSFPVRTGTRETHAHRVGGGVCLTPPKGIV